MVMCCRAAVRPSPDDLSTLRTSFDLELLAIGPLKKGKTNAQTKTVPGRFGSWVVIGAANSLFLQGTYSSDFWVPGGWRVLYFGGSSRKLGLGKLEEEVEEDE